MTARPLSVSLIQDLDEKTFSVIIVLKGILMEHLTRELELNKTPYTVFIY